MNEVTTENKPKGNGLLIAIIVAIVAALAIGGYFLYKNGMGEGGEASDVVATVDGAEISREDYDRSAAQLSSVFAAQGVDVSDAEAAAAIQDQALNTLINRQLVLNAASEAGTSVNDETVEAEYQAVVTNMGGEENLSAAIASTGVSLDQFRDDLETDLMINAYLANKVGTDAITVSDEEVEAAYNTAAEGGAEGLPPLEEVAEVIRGQLLSEKQQAAIGAELERLRGEAEIVILI